MSINSSKCFPSDWIGGKLHRENDYTYFIDGDGCKQVSMPSGYGKPINAYWQSDGVLVMESDIRNMKIFFVGSQRSFPAYSNESEPHETNEFRKAVEECKRLREEEEEESRPRSSSNESDSLSSSYDDDADDEIKKKDNGFFAKFLGTITLTLPAWWCLKLLWSMFKHYGSLVFLLPWRLITWPFRALLSSDTKVLTHDEATLKYPHYSFNIF